VALGLGTSAGRDVYRKVFRGGDGEESDEAARQKATTDTAGAEARESAERDAARREADQLKKRVAELEAQVEALRRQLASRSGEAVEAESDAAHSDDASEPGEDPGA
jgi:Tfp pilus assembly protein FimV